MIGSECSDDVIMILLDDNELITDKGDSELLALSCSDDTHYPEYDDSDLNSPTYERDDRKNDARDAEDESVINVILNECMVLLRLYYETEDPENADISKDTIQLVVAYGLFVSVDDRLILKFIIFHLYIPSV